MLLDTDVLIDLERSHPAADAWLGSLTMLPAVSGFAAMELLNGSQNLRDHRRIERFLHPFAILWPSEADMSAALTIMTPLRLTHGLGMIDMLIAATAIGKGLPLVTCNIRYFRGVPGLVTSQPYQK